MNVKQSKNSKINKRYISDIDIALFKFDQTHPLSASQQSEINKYKQIYRLRDEKIESFPHKEDDF